MANKTFCDFCKKEVTGDLYTITIYRGKDDASILEQDACSSCAKSVQKLIVKAKSA